MRVWFWLYFIVFNAIGVAGWQEELKKPGPLWLMTLSAIATVLEVAGMLIYQFARNPRKFAKPWRFVFAFIVIVTFMSIVKDLADELREKVDLPLIMIVTAVVIVIYIPTWYMNARLAAGLGARRRVVG